MWTDQKQQQIQPSLSWILIKRKKKNHARTSKIIMRAFRVKCGASMVNTRSTTCRNRLEGLVNRLSKTSVNTSTQWGSSEIQQETAPLWHEDVYTDGTRIIFSLGLTEPTVSVKTVVEWLIYLPKSTTDHLSSAPKGRLEE